MQLCTIVARLLAYLSLLSLVAADASIVLRRKDGHGKIAPKVFIISMVSVE